MMTPQSLEAALTELGTLAFQEGKVIDLAIYGGSALMLASNFRLSTHDIDAVADTDQAVIDRLAGELATRHGWPSDWINDGVRTYLSPKVDGVAEHHQLLRAYPSEQQPGVRVFVPTAEYMLAMKLMAMRLDDAAGKSDLADIVNLLAVVGLKSPDDTLRFAAGFYPEARISGRVVLGIRELWRSKDTLTLDRPDDPPQYLGRSRSTPE